jgi:hypothetical protein
VNSKEENQTFVYTFSKHLASGQLKCGRVVRSGCGGGESCLEVACLELGGRVV